MINLLRYIFGRYIFFYNPKRYFVREPTILFITVLVTDLRISPNCCKIYFIVKDSTSNFVMTKISDQVAPFHAIL